MANFMTKINDWPTIFHSDISSFPCHPGTVEHSLIDFPFIFGSTLEV